MGSELFMTVAIIIGILFIGILALIIKTFKKAEQGKALVRTGQGGTKVSFSGIFAIPVLHRLESMDITVKTIIIARQGKEGLVCRDNLRADIKVSFYVRVNKTTDDVIQVAQSIGCQRASDSSMLIELFDSKFSEALKTVGKQFDFVDLYNSRDNFKAQILSIIGTDLNGYVLDDCAIDYLEQTPLESLSMNNILDSEGIKKITELTSIQQMKANEIVRKREMTIKKQDTEAREAILQLERDVAEKENLQRREIANIEDRENAEIQKVKEEQRLKGEKARIASDEEIEIAERNKQRQVIIAEKNRERTEVVETEKVLREKELEQTEREKIVEIARIEKEKAVEEQKRDIQEVIKERVIVEKSVVEEEEKTKEIKIIAEAQRMKQSSIIYAEKSAEQNRIEVTVKAQAEMEASKMESERKLIEATAESNSAVKKAEAMKIIADAEASQEAAKGLAEAQVIEAKADAMEKQGLAEAKVLEATAKAEAASIEEKSAAEAKAIDAKGTSEAKVVEIRAAAEEKKGAAENKIMEERYYAEAKGVEAKAEAMKKLDGVGKEHEEFKLRLEKDTEVKLKQIDIQKDIAREQATVISEALKAAKIDIVGGETMFFDQIIGSITKGKSIDRLVEGSDVVSDLKQQFFNSAGGKTFKENLTNFIDQLGVTTEEVRGLTLNSLFMSLSKTVEGENKSILEKLYEAVKKMGLGDQTLDDLGL